MTAKIYIVNKLKETEIELLGYNCEWGYFYSRPEHAFGCTPSSPLSNEGSRKGVPENQAFLEPGFCGSIIAMKKSGLPEGTEGFLTLRID